MILNPNLNPPATLVAVVIYDDCAQVQQKVRNAMTNSKVLSVALPSTGGRGGRGRGGRGRGRGRGRNATETPPPQRMKGSRMKIWRRRMRKQCRS